MRYVATFTTQTPPDLPLRTLRIRCARGVKKYCILKLSLSIKATHIIKTNLFYVLSPR